LNQVDPTTAAPHLRLVWPQWQRAGTESVRSLAPEFPSTSLGAATRLARRCSKRSCLSTMARPLSCPSKWAISGLRSATASKRRPSCFSSCAARWRSSPNTNLRVSRRVGGECSVSMAPFSYLINKHGDDLAWPGGRRCSGAGGTDREGFPAADTNSCWLRPDVLPGEVGLDLVGGRRTRGGSRRAHQAAVKDALAFIEKHALFTRTGPQGIRQG
jgi:arginase